MAGWAECLPSGRASCRRNGDRRDANHNARNHLKPNAKPFVLRVLNLKSQLTKFKFFTLIFMNSEKYYRDGLLADAFTGPIDG